MQKGSPEQAHRPTKWGPLFTHNNNFKKGQGTSTTITDKQQNKTTKYSIVNQITKKMKKIQYKNGKLHKHNKNIQENRTIQINHH